MFQFNENSMKEAVEARKTGEAKLRKLTDADLAVIRKNKKGEDDSSSHDTIMATFTLMERAALGWMPTVDQVPNMMKKAISNGSKTIDKIRDTMIHDFGINLPPRFLGDTIKTLIGTRDPEILAAIENEDFILEGKGVKSRYQKVCNTVTDEDEDEVSSDTELSELTEFEKKLEKFLEPTGDKILDDYRKIFAGHLHSHVKKSGKIPVINTLLDLSETTETVSKKLDHLEDRVEKMERVMSQWKDTEAA